MTFEEARESSKAAQASKKEDIFMKFQELKEDNLADIMKMVEENSNPDFDVAKWQQKEL